MMRRKHLRRDFDPGNVVRMYCGLRMSKERYRELFETEMPMCAKCDDNRFIEDRRMEEEAEKLVKAGVLEEDLGPNRQWNEY